MAEIHVHPSDSELSVDSWTLIEEGAADEDRDSVGSSDTSSLEIVEVGPETAEAEGPTGEDSEGERSDGFLAFDEFLQERLLDCDSKQAEKKGRKKGRRAGRKCKAPNFGISVFITIILALTAFATLCSTLSQTAADKGAEGAPKRSEAILRDINESIKEFEHFHFLKNVEEKAKNDTLLQCPRKSEAMPLPRVLTARPAPDTPRLKMHRCDGCRSAQKHNKVRPKGKTTWVALKEFLLDTNFHALVSLIMTNIYLFTLLVDCARRPVNKSITVRQLKQKIFHDLEKRTTVEETKRQLFKELPFWNADISEKKPKKKLTRAGSKESKTTNTLAMLNPNGGKNESVLFGSCPFLAENSSKALVPAVVEETGKSECQRRFEELDQYQSKFDELKQTQRNRIKLLKQKFKNEVSYIRDTEEESEARIEKINKTSQRFIRKLKYNREKYLLELKKVKELRLKVASAKTKNSVQDVATGSYMVALPPIYDYSEKFKMIKEKFERENPQLPQEWKL